MTDLIARIGVSSLNESSSVSTVMLEESIPNVAACQDLLASATVLYCWPIDCQNSQSCVRRRTRRGNRGEGRIARMR